MRLVFTQFALNYFILMRLVFTHAVHIKLLHFDASRIYLDALNSFILMMRLVFT